MRPRGVSAVIVLILIAVMVGLAVTVVMTTEQDLSTAAHERDQTQAFYSAEMAVARARAFLADRPALYDARTGWTPLLTSELVSVQAARCLPGTQAQPGTQPPGTLETFPGWAEAAARFGFCLHNNADDPGYLVESGPPAGDTSDAADPLHLITIEAYGAVGRARAHLSVTVGPALETWLWQEL